MTSSASPPPSDASLRPTEAEALLTWRRLIEADREQVERLRENSRSEDFYAPVAASFRPGQRDSVEWPVVEGFAREGDTWLDIGAGGGRFAVPLAGIVKRVVAVEPSEAMRTIMVAAAIEAGRANIEVVDTHWPADGWSIDADVSLAAHSTYDIEEIEPFIEAMERHTSRTCIAIFGCRARGAQLADLFEAVHDEPMATLPSLREFVALLGAMGRRYEVRTAGTSEERERARPAEEAYAVARRLLWLAPNTEKDAKMQQLVTDWYGTPEGIALPSMRPWIGIVSWEPRR
jgi:SAM-dependent methyltransferase